VRRAIDILVADDSDHDVEITLYALRRVVAEAAIMRVKDGEQTLQFLFGAGGYAGRAAGMPQLLLLDMQMPALDGLEVLEILRSRPTTRELPIVLFTSSSNPALIERATALGASDYRIKPDDFQQYCAEVEDIARTWLLAQPLAAKDAAR
jgi:two-component system response regulator